MTNVKMRALMGASALVLTTGLAAGAHAQAVSVYGGGSTLSAPYVRQAEDCYGQQTPLYTPGKPATNPPPETFTAVVGTSTVTTNCATTQADPDVQMNLEASGSGAGVLAFFDHNGAALGAYLNTSGVSSTFPTEHYGTSDTAMGSADVDVYNNGGATDPATGKAVNVVAPGVTPGAGQFANPATTYGAMVQVPLLVTPITVAFSPVYKKVLAADGTTVNSFSFNISNAANKGVLRLDLPTYCKVFNGQITDWNDPAIARLNGKMVTVKATASTPAYVYFTPLNAAGDPDVHATTPTATGQTITITTASGPVTYPIYTGVNNFSQPIELVGRSDGSGTTSIFSRALAAQCSGLAGVTNQYPDAASTLPSALISSTQPATPGSGLFTVQKGSGGVASYLQFTATPAGGAGSEVTTGKIAYLSPDYAGNGSTTIPSATYGLAVAALQNYANAISTTATTKVFELPTAKAALASFGTLTPPAAGTGAGTASDPSAWVQAPSKTAAIATPTSATGYPIVGTTQLLAYTCYADTTANSVNNIGYKMNQFLKFYLTNPIVTQAPVAGTTSGGILYTYGFAPMPKAWLSAELKYFVTPSSTGTLYISPKSDILNVSFVHNKACDSVTGG